MLICIFYILFVCFFLLLLYITRILSHTIPTFKYIYYLYSLNKKLFINKKKFIKNKFSLKISIFNTNNVE